jgi:hypothetical protein
MSVVIGPRTSFDSDAVAFLTAAEITDPTIFSAIDTLVKNLKSANIWTKMKALYPFVGNTATTHKWNLKDPRDLDAAFRLLFNGGWTHDSTGALSNGINGYADTKLVPNTDLDNTIAIASYNPDLTTVSAFISGCQNSTTRTLRHQMITVSLYFRTPNLSNNPTPFVNAGFNGGSRVSNTLCYAMVSDGTTNSDTSTQTELLPSFSIYLSALNNNNSPSGIRALTFSFYAVSTGLSILEMDSFRNIIQTFQTTLGRNV